MSKKLTLNDRHSIGMYTRRIPCTLAIRGVIDKFFAQIEITPEEFKKYNVKIDPETLEFQCENDEYTVEYKEFPKEILEGMKAYIHMFDHEKAKDNKMLQRSFKYFRKIL